MIISITNTLSYSRKMAIYWICLVSLFGLALGDSSCPDAKTILPCTCDGEGFNCMGAKNLEEIKAAFRAQFPYNAVRSVWVQGTPITSLPDGLFGVVKSQQFYVEVNNITTVDVKAFRASAKSLSVLSLFGNKIVDFPFSDLSMFESLSTLNMGRNQIETIPANAFNSRSLWAIILAQNKIKTIGMNAFANLPSLGRLEMALNQIVTLGPMSMAMKSHSAQLQINLSANKITEVSSTAFNGADPYAIFFSQNQLKTLKKDAFETLVTKVANKGGFIEVSYNPLSCKGCDYSWITLNKDLLAQKLVGFTCEDGKSIHDLTKTSIGCN